MQVVSAHVNENEMLLHIYPAMGEERVVDGIMTRNKRGRAAALCPAMK